MDNKFDFWGWFFRGPKDGKCGFIRVFDKMIALHVIIGFIVAKVVPLPISQSASTVLLPLSGALIGLTFAWAGNAHGMLQTEEISKVISEAKTDYITYVYTYQSTILIVLVAIILWGLASLRVFDVRHSYYIDLNLVIETALFSYTSITIRECWHAVLGTQLMLISRKIVKDES